MKTLIAIFFASFWHCFAERPGMMMRSGKGGAWLRVTGAALALMMLGACASPPEDADTRAAFEEENDPLQDFNRYIHEVNYAFDQLVFRPISGMYRTGVPRQIRGAIRNFFDNLRSPVIFVNDLLQGEGERAGITLARFLTNSTIGLGGLIDTAEMAFGLEFHDEDFGQTLAIWGADEGIYLVLPVFGPSNPRDAVGIAVDSFLDPWDTLLRAAGVEYGPPARTILNAVDLRSRNIDTLDEIERTSIDYYATLRSLYRQRRADEIRNGIPTAIQPMPVFRSPDEESQLMQPPPEGSRDLLESSTPFAMSPIYIESLMPGSGALRVYVEAVDDFLGYRFTIDVDGHVKLHLSAKTCEGLEARIGRLLPSNWPTLLNASSVAESLASCRSGVTSGQA